MDVLQIRNYPKLECQILQSLAMAILHTFTEARNTTILHVNAVNLDVPFTGQKNSLENVKHVSLL